MKISRRWDYDKDLGGHDRFEDTLVVIETGTAPSASPSTPKLHVFDLSNASMPLIPVKSINLSGYVSAILQTKMYVDRAGTLWAVVSGNSGGSKPGAILAAQVFGTRVQVVYIDFKMPKGLTLLYRNTDGWIFNTPLPQERRPSQTAFVYTGGAKNSEYMAVIEITNPRQMQFKKYKILMDKYHIGGVNLTPSRKLVAGARLEGATSVTWGQPDYPLLVTAISGIPGGLKVFDVSYPDHPQVVGEAIDNRLSFSNEVQSNEKSIYILSVLFKYPKSVINLI